MAALSNYLESGLLNFVFRGENFAAPSNISIALVSGVKEADKADADTGTTILELPSGINGSGTGYSRVNLGAPGTTKFSYTQEDFETGSGTVRNSGQIVFNTALLDWGWVSGIAIVDHATVGSGNVLMYAKLTNPRYVYTGDNIKFDQKSLEISLK